MQVVDSTKFLSKRVIGLKPSGIRKFFDIAATMKDVISLGIGEPDFTTPKPILDAGVRSLQAGETHYTSNSGKLELRQAIANNLERLYGVKYNPVTEIIATVGVSEALYLAFVALLDPGDEVIIPTPCFVSYQAEVYLAGGIPVELPAKMENNFQVDPDEVRAAITPRTKAIFIGYPSNPTGAVAERETLMEIAKIAIEHNLVVVSDEIYDRLVYDFKHVCFPALGEELKQRTVLLGGFSKSHAMTGWRIGYAAGPKNVITAMANIQSQSTSNPTSISQKAAVEALRGPQDFIGTMNIEFDKRRKYMVQRLNAMKGVSCLMPVGAFYAFPRVSALYGKSADGKAIKNSSDLAAYLLDDARVALVSGDAFGADAYIRLSYATSMETIEKGLNRIENAVGRLK